VVSFFAAGAGPELSEVFGQILHEVTTSSKFAVEDAFCRSKGYYRNALADENRWDEKVDPRSRMAISYR